MAACFAAVFILLSMFLALLGEGQEAVHSPSEAVQFHALSLLYSIKSHDKLAVSKMVAQMQRVSMSSPLADTRRARTCRLLARRSRASDS